MSSTEVSHRENYAMTLRCYNSMETTKRRHFEFLSVLEMRQKKFNIAASVDEKTLLASLLADHDTEVKAFKASSDELMINHPTAHRALFEYIGRINSALDDSASH